jgi:hypothetical protein
MCGFYFAPPRLSGSKSTVQTTSPEHVQFRRALLANVFALESRVGAFQVLSSITGQTGIRPAFSSDK